MPEAAFPLAPDSPPKSAHAHSGAASAARLASRILAYRLELRSLLASSLRGERRPFTPSEDAAYAHVMRLSAEVLVDLGAGLFPRLHAVDVEAFTVRCVPLSEPRPELCPRVDVVRRAA